MTKIPAKVNKPDIVEITRKYLSVIDKEEYPRYKSWDYCHNSFSVREKDNTHTLQLAVYLASWGMYRGSGGILQKNYLVHEGAVDILFEKKNQDLKCHNNREISKIDMTAIFELKLKLTRHYSKIKFKLGINPEKPISATSTLISKIMLGAYGCVPAYDQYFIKGLSSQEMVYKDFNHASINELLIFANTYEDDFTEAQKMIFHGTGKHYPIMKVIDMYFWQIGYDLELVEKRNKDK